METLPTMTDASGNNNNGNATAAVTSVTGSNGKGYGFHSSTAVVTVPNSASLNPGTSDFSVTADLKFNNAPSTAAVDYDVIRKGTSTTAGGEWKMEIYPPSGSATGPAFCLFKDSKGVTASIRGPENLANGAWHTVTCAKTATSIKLIVDGAVHTKAATLGSISNTEPVGLGQKPGGGDVYVGDMDEVHIDVGTASGGGDITPPKFTAGTPANNALGVALATNVTATFSEKVTGVGTSTFTVTQDGGTPVPVTAYTSNTTGTKWTLDPAGALLKDTWYTVTLTSGIKDVAGNALSPAPVTWRFLTGLAPKVTAMTPPNGATNVSPVTPGISATFSETVKNVTASTFTLTGPAGPVTATVKQSATSNKWLLTATGLLPATTYTVTVVGGPSGVTDNAGNPLPSNVTWTFTTL
jgi:hypothetical protein